MNALLNSSQPSTYQQWNSFRSILNEHSGSDKPLLTKGNSADRLITSLEKQLPKEQQQVIFRRLGRHTQLVLNFTS